MKEEEGKEKRGNELSKRVERSEKRKGPQKKAAPIKTGTVMHNSRSSEPNSSAMTICKIKQNSTDKTRAAKPMRSLPVRDAK